ncbi:MAG: prolyl oligopeptidase family serine peptidase [Planctomycetaceae bacterium]|nr:prolyl oligopeptidase family serine peptidase [Planctomycetaceae bacterium]
MSDESLSTTSKAAEKVVEKKLPLPGELFQVEGHASFLIPASQLHPQGGRPWVWYAPTLPNLPGMAEKWMFERFTQAGIAVAGIDVGESFGSPDGQRLYSALYKHMTEQGYSTQPVLLGRSRRGLMTLCWAVNNPEKVGGFAGIYPVCNIASYPGLQRAAGAYERTAEQLQQELAKFNPVDRITSLNSETPLFVIHGDIDTVVPLEANSGLLRQRWEAAGGKMELIVPAGQGHNMWPGFFECEKLVEFVRRNAH